MLEYHPFGSEKTQERADWLLDCAAIFNGPKLHHHDVAVYLKAVRCPDPDTVIDAFKYWLRTQRHFPAPVNIRQIIEKKSGDKEYKESITLEYHPFDSEKTQECAGWLLDCAAIFNGPKLSRHDAVVYLKAVCCPNPDTVIDALKYWLRTQHHFPSPVDIRQVIEQKDSDAAGPIGAAGIESDPFDEGKNRECAHLLRLCAELYNGSHLSDRDIADYFNAVDCTDSDKVYQALDHCFLRVQHFPSPMDIRSRIREIEEGKIPIEDADTRAKQDRIRPLSPARWSPGAPHACGTANLQGRSSQAQSDYRAGAYPAASGGHEESHQSPATGQDVSE